MRKGFRTPSHGREIVSESPGGAAISRVSDGAIVCPAGMLWRRVEIDKIQYWGEKWKNNFERLDRTIKILIVDGVLIVPDTGSGAGDFVTDEYDSVVSRIGLDLVYCSACPGRNSRLHSHRRADW